MAKRFTDTDIWDKEWFMNLSPTLKCLVKYVRDKGNLAGVWHPNYKLASTYIGETVTEDILLSIDNGKQFLKLDCGKIFCIGFINFQYGEKLNEKSPVHKKIIDILNKHTYKQNSLFNTLFNRVSDTIQEEEEDKEEEMVKEEDFGKSENLLPKMFQIFKKKKPNYPGDQTKDFHALKNISSFICKQSALSYQPREPDVVKTVLDAWELITDYLKTDDFYGNKSLQSISFNIQSIVQKIQHESTSGKTSGKPGSKINGSQLDTALTKFRNKGKPVGHT